jgi:multicomponent K+:H+ antiporter subunit F
MLNFAINVAFAMLGVAMLLSLWRMLRGPSVADRILALDALYINVIAVLLLFGINNGSHAYFESALLIAVIGFVSTVALCKYVLNGRLM